MLGRRPERSDIPIVLTLAGLVGILVTTAKLLPEGAPTQPKPRPDAPTQIEYVLTYPELLVASAVATLAVGLLVYRVRGGETDG